MDTNFNQGPQPHVVVQGKRDLSAASKFWWWVLILFTGFTAYPFYWNARRKTTNVRY